MDSAEERIARLERLAADLGTTVAAGLTVGLQVTRTTNDLDHIAMNRG